MDILLQIHNIHTSTVSLLSNKDSRYDKHHIIESLIDNNLQPYNSTQCNNICSLLVSEYVSR